MKHNEDTRVKIPLVIHLLRLGYVYLSLKDEEIDVRNNIFKKTFKESLEKINGDIYSDEKIEELLTEISELSKYDDLGESLYRKLTSINGIDNIKLIDFNDVNNNTFNVVTELTFKNKEEEFRPDVTILINGIPICFYEVKKPNNSGGIQSEFTRAKDRLRNPSFNHFFNQIQLMLFSNNMEYDDTELSVSQGSFYATPNKENTKFSYFREEKELSFEYHPTDNDILKVLSDNNYEELSKEPEFKMNISPYSPANSFATSLLHKDRMMFIIKYGLVYVLNNRKSNDETKSITEKEKHIIRYQQIFAIYNLIERLDNGITKGIVWHTQGSGKTSLAYFISEYLTNYFKAPSRYFFIVDRLDLLEQAHRELSMRGLKVGKIANREEFISKMKDNKTGVYVVNIQKFEECKLETNVYSSDVQNVFFIDEAHRSYNPKGSFLGRLLNLDNKAIYIALTGTPLLSKEYNSTDVWGSYIHKYYYNKSISDKYTLKIMQEKIVSIFGESIEYIIKETQIKIGAIDKNQVYCHENYYTKICEYIDRDFTEFRYELNDNSLGAMIVCNTSEQAKSIHGWIEKNSELKAKLILHDVGDKQERKEVIKNFKKGMYDILIVYNMLLTGFDAPRLKKMYLLRTLHKHNLLQGLTRVNRPYTNPNTGEAYEFGYVVDFAGIHDEYNITNAEYLEELKSDMSGFDSYADISTTIISKEELKNRYFDIMSNLAGYTIDNCEIFCNEISTKNLSELYKLRECFSKLKSLYTQLKILKYEEYYKKIDIGRVCSNFTQINDRINYLYLKEKASNKAEYGDLIDEALEDVVFEFTKIETVELSVDESYLKSILKKTREELLENQDKDDEKYVKLYDELMRLVKEITDDRVLNISGMTISVKDLLEEIKELNKENEELIKLYGGDKRCMRIHKRIIDSGVLKERNIKDCSKVIMLTKYKIDDLINKNSQTLENKSYFTKNLMQVVCEIFKANGYNKSEIKVFGKIYSTEYIN